MLQIENTLISLDVIEKKFSCDLSKCKGACCVQGDSGAPLADDEIDIIKKEYRSFKKYLRPEGRKAIGEQGIYVIDSDNEKVTPLIDGKECAFVIFEDGIARCGIEKAFFEGKTNFRKPVSCHLYPIRIRKYEKFKAVNYDIWKICDPARAKGEKENIRVCNFTREALHRKFGEEWLQQLDFYINNTDHSFINK